MNEMHEFYRAFFAEAPIGLTVFDDECNPVDCNEVMLDMLDAPKDYYLAKYFEFFPDKQPDGENSREKVLHYIDRAITGERMQVKWTHCTSDGSPISCAVTLSRIEQGDEFVNLAYVYDLRGAKEPEKTEDTYTDPLTGAYNRRYMGENLNGLISFLSRAKSVLTVMMLEVDDFRSFVEIYGEQEGNKSLKAITEILRKNITRIGDYVVRYADERFAVVLPNTDESGAKILAGRILEDLRERAIPHTGSRTGGIVTCSVGVTTGRVSFKHVGGDYVRLADEMLKKAKEEGCNRYCFTEL